MAWTADSGSWDNPENWSGGSVPGTAQKVLIDRPGDVTVTVSSRVSVEALVSQEKIVVKDGGTLQLQGNAELNGGLNLEGSVLSIREAAVLRGTSRWLDGTIEGQGELVNEGTLTITGDAVRRLETTLTNRGTIVESGNHEIRLARAKLVNENGGTYEIQAGVLNGWTSPFSFTNRGKLKKTTDEEANIHDTNFTNSGSISVDAGELRLTGTDQDATLTDSTYSVAEGAALSLEGHQVFKGVHEGEIHGEMVLRSGAVAVPEGSTSTLRLTGNGFRWRNGNFDVNGELVNEAKLVMSGDATRSLQGSFGENGSTLTNRGTIIESGNHEIRFTRAELVNENAGTYEIQAGVLHGWTSPFSFTNRGKLKKTTDAEAAVNDVNFTHSGSISVEAGELRLTGTDKGSIATDAAYSVAEEAILSLEGRHTFKGEHQGEIQGDLVLTGILLAPEESTATLNFTGNGFQWSKGAISGRGEVVNEGTLTITGDAVRTLGTTLINRNAIVDSGHHDIRFSGGHLVNEEDASYEIQAGRLVGWTSPFSFTNRGEFVKTTDASAVVDVEFDNSEGTIEVQAGDLEFTGGGTNLP